MIGEITDNTYNYRNILFDKCLTFHMRKLTSQ